MTVTSPVSRGIANARRGFAFARAILRDPITPSGAAASVRARMAGRAPSFLAVVERAIFASPASPYRPLLDAAGYDLPRVRALAAAGGVEAALKRLRDDGVYITIDEFKGLKEVRRGNRAFRVTPEAFDNPLAAGGLVASSGGTRSRGVATTISPENLRMGAEHLMVAIAAYGLESTPVVVWLPTEHGASLWAVLALAAMGKTPPRWFTQIRVSSKPTYLRPHQVAIRGWSALRGVHLPAPTYVPLADPSPIVRWVAEPSIRGRCAIFTTPSSALRLALVARRQGLRLGGITFITIGEPLTPAKGAGIEAAGARAFSSLGFTEFGRATYGCAAPAAVDDTHVCSDAVAVIQRRRAVDRMGTEVDALLFTALRPDARKILLNMETGDYAMMSARRCGCLLEAVGWTDHLDGIRSFEKLNAEGRLFFGSEVITLVEEILPRRFGGDPTDYQLLEEEDRDGFTRLSVLVHPRLGPVDTAAVVDCVERTLSGTHPTRLGVWQEAGTIRVRRQAPVITKAGKLMPLHHLGLDHP